MRNSHKVSALIVFSVAGLTLATESVTSAAVRRSPTDQSTAQPAPQGKIAPYEPRFGRTRPVIALVGENSGTELTDFVIPFGVLSAAKVGDVVTVATHPGLITMRPALHVKPQATVAEFDKRFPEGADYVIVPAMVERDDRALLTWISQQAAKGATLVSICDGALVVANTGLLKGHRATAHWATSDFRRKTYPDVRWVQNARYVADGRIVSSAGISAAVPTALALVEAIGGHNKAAAVAHTLKATDWSTAHNSEIFRPKLGRNLSAFAATNYFNGWFHKRQSIGIPITAGADEIALAFTADAYSRTGRSKAYAVSSFAAPVVTLHGLTVIPDRVAGEASALDRTVSLPTSASAPILDTVLAEIARDYGHSTAFGVALDFEYPGYHD